jgi:hypothetical protein
MGHGEMGHVDRFIVPFALFHWDKEPMSEQKTIPSIHFGKV